MVLSRGYSNFIEEEVQIKNEFDVKKKEFLLRKNIQILADKRNNSYSENCGKFIGTENNNKKEESDIFIELEPMELEKENNLSLESQKNLDKSLKQNSNISNSSNENGKIILIFLQKF